MLYVIWTTTGREEEMIRTVRERVDGALYSRVFTLYREEKHKINGTWRILTKVLFPGYIFIETDRIEEVLIDLVKISEFSLVLGTDGDPLPVHPKEEALLSRLAGKNETIEMSTGFIEGDRVIVTGGPLAGLEGLITKINRHKRRAVIAVTMFERDVEMEVGLEIVGKT